MNLYHGTNIRFKTPRIIQPNRALDFGSGFYTTTDIEQAKSWAKVVVRRSNNGIPLANDNTMPVIQSYIDSIQTNEAEKDFFVEFALRQLRADKLKDQTNVSHVSYRTNRKCF